MTLSQLLKGSPAFKRVVIIGYDGRIKHIYDKPNNIPGPFLDMHVYGHILHDFGDLDVKLNL